MELEIIVNPKVTEDGQSVIQVRLVFLHNLHIFALSCDLHHLAR